MKVQKTLYKKYKFSDIPLGKKIFITNDNQKLYYCNEQLNIYVQNIENIPTNANKLINIIVSTTQLDDITIVSLFIQIDGTVLHNCITNPINFIERSKLMITIKQCYEELCVQYRLDITEKLLKNVHDNNNQLLINKNVKNEMKTYNDKNLEWMIQCEQNSEVKYCLQQPLLQLDKYFVNIETSKFLGKSDVNSNKKLINLKGGILVNNSSNWMDDFINLSSLSSGKNNIRDGYLETTATLILCSKLMCDNWKVKIGAVNDSSKYIIINNNIDHKKVTYDNIKNATFVIVNVKYILGCKYKNIWKEYMCGKNTNMDVMQSEYITNKHIIAGYFYPIFSFFYWNRIIIGSEISCDMIKNIKLRDVLFGHNGNFSWIQLNKLPLSHVDIMCFIKYLLRYTGENLLLYDSANNLSYLNNIIRLSVSTKSNVEKPNPQIKESLIRVNMSHFEKKVYNFCIENSHDKNNKQFTKILIDCINQLSVNWLPYNDIINNIKKSTVQKINKLTSQLNNKTEHNVTSIQYKISVHKNELVSVGNAIDEKCKICCDSDELDDVVILKCGHYFCINCALNIIKYTSTCPYCRGDVNVHTMYHIKQKKELCGSKLRSLIDYINCEANNNLHKYLIVCKYSNVMKYILQGLKPNYNSLQLVGTYLGKIGKINNFNNQNNGIMIITFDDIGMMDNMKNLSNIIFYDNPYIDNILDKQKLHNLDIYDKHILTKINYMAYNNTIETRIIKVEN